MAETERTALLIEQGLMHGVKLAGGRDGTTVATAWSWPVAEGASPVAGGDAAAVADDTGGAPAAPFTETLRLAKNVLKIDGGCALALPTSDLIIKVLSLPPADEESLGAIVRLQMEKIAPCSGDDLSVGYEVIAQEESGVRLFAAALPKTRLDSLAQQLAASAVRLTRLDAALLGWWRQLVDLKLPALAEGMAAVLFEQGGTWDFVLAQRGEILLARGFGVLPEAGDLGRELTLSLLNFEMESGPVHLNAVLVVSAASPEAPWMEAIAGAAGRDLAPRWMAREQLGQPGLGSAQREGEAGRLDLIPPAWRQYEHHQQKRRRFLAGIAAGLGLWVLLAVVLFGAPIAIRHRTAAIATRIADGEAEYRSVSEVRQRVRLIRSYMDRSQSLLEILRAVCTVKPEGLEFGSVTYRRDDVVKLVGDADQQVRVYALKEALDASRRFETTRLNGPSLDARRRYRFEIDARFPGGAK
jgi:hypothetical protein